MEIEGIIQHTLAGLHVKFESLQNQMRLCDSEIYNWDQLRQIHANEGIQHAIEGLTSVRQLMSSEKYMLFFIGNSPEDTFQFMGFHLEAIQFYMELRDACYAKEQQREQQAEINTRPLDD